MHSRLYQHRNDNNSLDPTACDSITIELHDASVPDSIAVSVTGILHTDGSVSVLVPYAVSNNSYYIAIRHRNALQTWSKDAVIITNSPAVTFDFTTQ